MTMTKNEARGHIGDRVVFHPPAYSPGGIRTGAIVGVCDDYEGLYAIVRYDGDGHDKAAHVDYLTLMREIPVPTRGSGLLTCCGGHRERCLFGDMHVWGTWFEDAKLQRTFDTFYCHKCGGVCTADERLDAGRSDAVSLYAEDIEASARRIVSRAAALEAITDVVGIVETTEG